MEGSGGDGEEKEKKNCRRGMVKKSLCGGSGKYVCKCSGGRNDVWKCVGGEKVGWTCDEGKVMGA